MANEKPCPRCGCYAPRRDALCALCKGKPISEELRTAYILLEDERKTLIPGTQVRELVSMFK